MSNIAAKTSSNVFYKARCGAAKHNDSLSNREGAADIMSIDRGGLYRIESGVTDETPEMLIKWEFPALFYLNMVLALCKLI